jgi:hypothetical protein
MALKPDRYEFQTDISYYCNDVTNRGVVLIHGSSGSGAALDQTQAIAALPGTGVTVGLKPLGILLNDMVSINTNRQILNVYKDEMMVGSKCTILRKGWVVTDQIAAGVTPVAGDAAYLAPNGKITNAATGTPPQIGTFLSAKDQAGYAKVEVNLP